MTEEPAAGRREAYWRQNVIERHVILLKENRGLGTRYEKLVMNYLPWSSSRRSACTSRSWIQRTGPSSLLRFTPTDVTQYVRLEQCERFLRFPAIQALLWKNLFLRTCTTLLWEGERNDKRVAVWSGQDRGSDGDEP